MTIIVVAVVVAAVAVGEPGDAVAVAAVWAADYTGSAAACIAAMEEQR